jgi:hypothetical protein
LTKKAAADGSTKTAAKKLRIPDEWIDETSKRSGDVLTIIGAARPGRPKETAK